MENVIVGLDIGTTKTCAVIGSLNENNQIEIIGVGTAPSKGLKNGVIVNIDNTVASVAKAIDEAELMAGYGIFNILHCGSCWRYRSNLDMKKESEQAHEPVTATRRRLWVRSRNK